MTRVSPQKRNRKYPKYIIL